MHDNNRPSGLIVFNSIYTYVHISRFIVLLRKKVTKEIEFEYRQIEKYTRVHIVHVRIDQLDICIFKMKKATEMFLILKVSNSLFKTRV